MTAPHSLEYTGPTAEDLTHIPAVLKARLQWVLWRGEDRVEKQTGEVKLNKIPVDPQTLRNADTTDPVTWGAFEACIQALPVVLEEWEGENPSAFRGGGIGFVFTETDPYCGIDLDGCVALTSGTIARWARKHMDALRSYTEITPSGTGLHILVDGTLPPRGRKKGKVETYNYARFFTVTGWHVAETPCTIEPRQEALTAFHEAVFGTAQARDPAQDTPPSPTLEDIAILEKARAAKNAPKFARLWAGDTSLHDGDDSGADMALCSILAFWTQDPAQIDRLFRQSGLMRDKWDERRGELPYGARTIREALARQTQRYRPRQSPKEDAQHRRNGHAAPASNDQNAASDGPLPLSDYTNALTLVRDHGQDLRYCEIWNKWLIWTGTHWSYRVQGPVFQKAKQTIKHLLHQAEELDDDRYRAWLTHIKRSLSTAAIHAMVKSAQDEPGMAIDPDQLNTHRLLLPCANGVLDLETGQLRQHARADFLTECLVIPYQPKARCPRFEAFLWYIMGGSQGEIAQRAAADQRATELIAYLQRIFGQCLTGDVREQDLYVFYGTGANGKSTLINLMLKLLAHYAMKATADLFMVTSQDRHPTERADLFGKRLVAAIETERGGRLNETFIKEATGGDPIRARRMREDFWEFLPTHKIILATNHKPTIRGTDHAIWRRIKLVPFTVTIPDNEQDATLPAALEAELPGILAWMVRGCRDWLTNGLRPPSAVLEATATYRQEQDVFEDFLATECFRHPSANCSAALLYEAYQKWCGANDVEEPLSKRAFGVRLGESGCTPDQGTGGRRLWRGIGLPTTDTEERQERTR
jgi:putative DNA primase/helicase